MFTTASPALSLAHRLALLEAVATAGVVAGLATVAAAEPAAGWGLPLRVGLVAGVCLACFYFNDLYDFEVPHDLSRLFGRLCQAVGWSALLLAVAHLVVPDPVMRGSLASASLLAVLPAVLGLRVGVYALVKRRPFSRRVVIMGTGSLAGELARHFQTRADLAVRLVGFLGGEDAAGRLPAPRLGRHDDVSEVVRRHRPDHIVVALPERRGQLPVAQLLACRVRGVRIEEGAHVFERLTRRLAVESLSPSVLIFGDGFRVARTQLLVKRVLSVLIALGALLLAAPAMALLALAIRLDDGRPVFFVQERVGLHGRIFRLIKFRTMREGGERAGPADAVIRDNASRVTRVGAVLRRYRLDELPNLINILRGDMSLVGPRPEMAANVATFSALIPFYNLRHEVRPGLTGWAQVRAGYSMSLEEVTRKLCYDLYYIKHLSVLFDLRILFDTVKFVLSGKRPG